VKRVPNTLGELNALDHVINPSSNYCFECFWRGDWHPRNVSPSPCFGLPWQRRATRRCASSKPSSST
jgi:hypothetical protein